MGRHKAKRGAKRERSQATQRPSANGVVMVNVDDRVAFGPAVDETDENARLHPVCHSCGQPGRQVDYLELHAFDPEAFAELGDTFSMEEIFTCCQCDACDRFGILVRRLDQGAAADDYFDPELYCGACGSYDVLVGDPAMAMRQDKASFLAARKEFGPAALLNGEAVWCQECGHIGYNPGDPEGFSIYGGPVDGAWDRP